MKWYHLQKLSGKIKWDKREKALRQINNECKGKAHSVINVQIH